jgi:hypothetical protein
MAVFLSRRPIQFNRLDRVILRQASVYSAPFPIRPVEKNGPCGLGIDKSRARRLDADSMGIGRP